MASNKDKNFNPSLLVGSIEGTTKEENKKKRGFTIDLNMAPPPEEKQHQQEEDLLNESKNGKGNNIHNNNNNLRWDALLDVSKISLTEYEEKKRTGSGSGSERLFRNGSTRKSAVMKECIVVVPRSTRERAVAMPTRFSDSVLFEPPELSRVNKTVGVKRKSRWS